MTQQTMERMANGGREASRQRRAQMVRGKVGLPVVAERTRTGTRTAMAGPVTNPKPVTQPTPEPVVAAVVSPKVEVAAPAASTPMPKGGRAASVARRNALVQGKVALKKTEPAHARANSIDGPASGRLAAEAVRAERAQKGKGATDAARPSGRVRTPEALVYAPKVADSKTYGAQRVTGVRIGRGTNVTGDEPGTTAPVSGTQYIAANGGTAYREGGAKVGASRTDAGQVVTGTQVRSKILITGDEFSGVARITGEADQTVDDDVLVRREQGVHVTAQFQRQNNPHGASVFGANLGRSVRTIGSRDRSGDEATLETTLNGHNISGTAVGRSPIVTGDEAGSCRAVTGSQYLRPADAQPLCDGDRQAPPMLRRMGTTPARGETETWSRQRITGVEVEFKPGVTGDEQGVCSAVTGTPYAGPRQYETYCAVDAEEAAAERMDEPSGLTRITGDLPLNSADVTGTARGADRDVTGTPYYRDEADVEDCNCMTRVQRIAKRFSVRSVQRDAQLDSGEPKGITGSFAVGNGKITGNQEFDFRKRWQGRNESSASPITGEGRMQGAAIMGGAWDVHGQVTGTEGGTAAGRNPSEQGQKGKVFAGAAVFKGKGKEVNATHHVTGMVGWSPKAAAKVTLSGGAQG